MSKLKSLRTKNRTLRTSMSNHSILIMVLCVLEVNWLLTYCCVSRCKQHGGRPANCGSDFGRGVLVSAVQLYILSGVEDEESGRVSQHQSVAV